MILESVHNIKLKKIAIAIGMFDGLHRGHVEVIQYLKKISNLNNLKSCVMSFNMNGNVRVNKERIIIENIKRNMIEGFGLDYYICPIFLDIKEMSPKEFVIGLIERLGVDFVICGRDFKFGYHRQGDVKYLNDVLKQYNKKLYVVKTKFIDGERISSSNIRFHIKNGDIKKANKLLGRNFSLDFELTTCSQDMIMQKIDSEFVSPPDGIYLSEIIYGIDQSKVHSQTVIETINGNKVAKTYFTMLQIYDIKSVRLIDKLDY